MVHPNSPSLPRRLNIGSGKNFRPDMLNADIRDDVNTDLVLDFSDPGMIGSLLPSDRFGPVTIHDGMLDEIHAYDVLEHIHNLVGAMENALALLANGGQFFIGVPYDLSYGAWQDPTHVRAFNERSWLYYTKWFWYLGWDKSRFDLTKITYDPSDIGKQMARDGVARDVILRTPRAIDYMNVILRKRPCTPHEVALVEKQFGRYKKPKPSKV